MTLKQSPEGYAEINVAERGGSPGEFCTSRKQHEQKPRGRRARYASARRRSVHDELSVPGEKTQERGLATWAGLLDHSAWLGLHLRGAGKALMALKQKAAMTVLRHQRRICVERCSRGQSRRDGALRSHEGPDQEGGDGGRWARAEDALFSRLSLSLGPFRLPSVLVPIRLPSSSRASVMGLKTDTRFC